MPFVFSHGGHVWRKYVLVPPEQGESEITGVDGVQVTTRLAVESGRLDIESLKKERNFVAEQLQDVRVHFGSDSEEVNLFLSKDMASYSYGAAVLAGIEPFPSVF